MTITIPEQVVRRAKLVEADILLRIAIELFKDEKVTLGQGSQIAKMHQAQFQKELAKRKVPIHYGVEEFEKDLETLAKLNLTA
jgi:predicted HTH domain antitoxin